MSSKTKRKYVCQEHMTEVEPPTGEQTIGRLLQTRGNNLHQVEDAAGHVYLASMPPKFRRNIWVRRGTFLMLEPIAEGDKVRAEVVRVLSRENVAELRRVGVWPERFEDTEAAAVAAVAERTQREADEVGGGLQDLTLEEGNPNRPPPLTESDESDETETESESEASDGDADRSSSESGA